MNKTLGNLKTFILGLKNNFARFSKPRYALFLILNPLGQYNVVCHHTKIPIQIRINFWLTKYFDLIYFILIWMYD